MIGIARGKAYLWVFYQARTSEGKGEVLDKYAQENLDMAADVNVNPSEVQNKMIIVGHQISSCHVTVFRSFFIL